MIVEIIAESITSITGETKIKIKFKRDTPPLAEIVSLVAFPVSFNFFILFALIFFMV